MKQRLKDEMKVAMKAKEKVKLQTIRGLLSAIQYEEMQQGTESLSDSATTAVLKTELKKRNESLEYALKDSRSDEVASIKIEIDYLESLLPSQMSEQDLEKIIIEITSSTDNGNLGAVMKALKEQYADQYDGKLASSIAKRVLEA